MAVISLFRRFFDWARSQEPSISPDPLLHPDVRQMSARALADLPIGASGAPALPEEPRAAATATPQLFLCA
jgi:hypothetical protein